MPSVEKAALKVVAHLRDHTLIKGYTDALPVGDLDTLAQQEPPTLPQRIPVRSADSGKLVKVPMASLKALFFVKSFEGRKDYNEIKFFEHHPAINGLLVHIRFFDDESTEGVLRNSLHHLVDPGFFLKLPDPESNNEMVYVLKASLADFRVFGVRSAY